MDALIYRLTDLLPTDGSAAGGRTDLSTDGSAGGRTDLLTDVLVSIARRTMSVL